MGIVCLRFSAVKAHLESGKRKREKILGWGLVFQLEELCTGRAALPALLNRLKKKKKKAKESLVPV